MGQPIVHFEIMGKDATRLHRFYADLFSWNDRPGRTAASVIACVPPAFVVIRPVVPVANGPSIATDRTSGFHSGHVRTSDQIRHTRSGLALASRVLPCSAIDALLKSQ